MKQITDKNITIEDIPAFKQEAKQKIEVQKVRLITTAQDLVPFSSSTTSTITPLALITAPFRKGKAMTIHAVVPPGTKAEICFPNGKRFHVTAGSHLLKGRAF